jgi:hypothetical protein
VDDVSFHVCKLFSGAVNPPARVYWQSECAALAKSERKVRSAKEKCERTGCEGWRRAEKGKGGKADRE